MKLAVILFKNFLNKKKIFVIGIVLLFFGSTAIPAFSISPISSVIKNMQNNKKELNPPGFFEQRMKIPKYCYDLSKAPSEYKVGNKLVEEEFNFPIGTFGNNYISYGPHGIDRIALYNNFNDSLGGSRGTGADDPQCLNGTFLGVFMNDGKNKVTKILQKFSPDDRKAKDYGLKCVEKMDCYSNIPIGYYQYHDSEFSAEIGLNIYSPIILYDIKNSTMPVSIWNFNAYNPTDDPIEVSFLFSLENDIGWRNKEKVTRKEKSVGTTPYRYIWQRTGTYNYMQENDEMLGIKFTYDKNLMSKSRPEFLGNMTLATIKQPDVTISYISEWDTLGNGCELLYNFTSSGELINQNNSNHAKEGESIYAGALSAKIKLDPGEGKNIPFVLATCFPIFNLSNIKGMSSNEFYFWNWTSYFNDSWTIADYSLNNYENWWTRINDWQEKLYNSGIPPEIMTYMLGTLSSIVSSAFFSKESYWFTSHPSLAFIGGGRELDWFLFMFYPEIMKYRIKEKCIAMEKYDGFVPGLWDIEGDFHREPRFIIRAYRTWIWNQEDDEFLKMIYQNCSKAVNFTMKRETYKDKDGLIHNRGNDQTISDSWVIPTSAGLNSLWLLSLKCMVNMAEKLQYYEDSEFYNKTFLKAQKSFIDTFWVKTLKHGYFKLCADKIGIYGWWDYTGKSLFPSTRRIIRDTRACTIDQIIGVRAGGLMDIDILPLEKTKEALLSIYDINYDRCHNLGWIESVMGHFPYRIDRFGAHIAPHRPDINPKLQWYLATSLLAYGLKEEAITVANLTTDNYLYNQGGGVYVTHTHNDTLKYAFGTNKINILTTWPSLRDIIRKAIWKIIGDPQWIWAEGHYPSKYNKNVHSWSFYQGAAGFTPCIDGIKIKPRLGRDNVCYIAQFAGCKITMDVTGTGDYIESVEINGKPYNTFIDEQVYIPLEEFNEIDEMLITITLS